MRRLVTVLLLLMPGVLAAELLSVSNADRQQLDPLTVWGVQDPGAAQSPQLTVINRAEIERSGAQTVAQLLDGRAGVQIERYGGNGQPALIRLRGTSAAQTVVLLNGVRISGGGSGTVDLSAIPAAVIQKIEIIRGGSGARYGSGAVGGAVNIITGQKQQANRLQLETGYASWNTWDGSLRWTGSSGKWRWQSAGYYGSSDGGYTFPGQQQPNPDGSYTLSGEPVKYLNSGYQQYGGRLRLGYRAADALHSLQLSGSFREAGVPGTIEFPTVEAVQRDKRASFGWHSRFQELLQKDDRLELRLDGRLLDREYRDFQLYQDAASHRNRRLSLEAEWRGRLGAAKLQLSCGGSYSRLVSNSYGSSEDTHANSAGWLFGSWSYRLGDRNGVSLLLNPIARLETAALYGTQFSPGIGAVLQTGSGRSPQLKLNFNRVYRAPSFDELFWPAGWFAEGNSALHPEYGWSWDGGVSWRPLANWQLSAVYFGSRLRELIYWQPGPGGIWKPLNLYGAVTHGMEAELSGRVIAGAGHLFKFSANYTLQFVRESGDPLNEGNQLPRRPHETGSVLLEWLHPRIGFVRGELKYTGFRYLNRANSKYLGDYLTVDLNAGIQLPGGLQLRFSVRNLLDRAYIHLLGHPVPGREFGIRLSWKAGN